MVRHRQDDRFAEYGGPTCEGPPCWPSTPAEYLVLWFRPEHPTFCKCVPCRVTPACAEHVARWRLAPYAAFVCGVCDIPKDWRPADGWPYPLREDQERTHPA